MLILLSDGAGLTARQCATVLARAGHRVEALSPAGLCLCRMTRHVRRVHDVPALGRDPSGWLEAALDVAARRGADVLLPVQEQVAVMALARDRIEAAGLATAVPGFAALAQVQDKVSAFRTLARAGVPQPPAVVAATAAEVEAAGAELARAGQAGWPLFVKMPIGTASAGVRRAGSPDELRQVAADYERLGAFGPEGVLVQQPVAGPLAMVQAVFARGELVAFHACQRVREGAAGGASHKLGLDLPEAREHMAAAGRGAGLARRAVRGRDHRPGRPAVHRHQPAARRAGQRPGQRRRPGRGAGRGGQVRLGPGHRSRPRCPGRGPTSCCSRCSARPTRAGGGTWRGSWSRRCCTAGSTGAAGRS